MLDSLNSQTAVESQLGYELYSSALADILSSPTLQTPMAVGLFAKRGSGKSFMLQKLRGETSQYYSDALNPNTLLYKSFAEKG